MITKGDLKKAKTLPEMEELLIRFRKEESPAIDRINEIVNEIASLRDEMRGLDKSNRSQDRNKDKVTEEDILLEIGKYHTAGL